MIARPDQYVGITTWKGDGGTGLRTISANFKFKPDFVWEKVRTTTAGHILYDSVRGFGNSKALKSNSTVAEGENDNATYGYVNNTFNGGIEIYGGSSAASDSFTNQTNQDMVAWCWKAGGNSNTFNIDDVGYASAAAAGITEGDNALIGASIGTKQGFSIVSFPITTAADGVISTFGHGLTQSPNFVVIKPINATSGGWTVYHSSLSNPLNNWMRLDTTAAAGDGTLTFSNSNTVFGIRETRPVALNLSANLIAYCWHDVPGLQKFGSYTGNSNADGPFIELGFRPALLWLKRTDSTGNWVILDSKRTPSNPANISAYADTATDANYSPGQDWADILSNGFKLRATYGEVNVGSYIYAAWAEAPTFNLYGAQSNAR